MSTDQDVLIGRIIQRWQHRTVPAAYDTPVLQQMAADAITALDVCGSPHPNRPAVVCTDGPDHGPDWHRNAGSGLEWSPDGHWTVHDELGPVTLVQQPPPPGPGRYVGLDRPVTIDPRDFQVGGVGPGNGPTPQPYCPAHGDTACTWCADHPRRVDRRRVPGLRVLRAVGDALGHLPAPGPHRTPDTGRPRY